MRQAIDADGFDWGPGFVDQRAHQRWAAQAIELLDLQAEQRVLDCGSGAGALSRYLSEIGVCTSLDLSEPLLRFGRRLGTVRGPIVGEAGHLPFGAGKFEAVLANSVFQYFPDLEYARQALREMVRVCRRGGRIVLMDVLDAAQKDAALAARAHSTRSGQNRGSADLVHLYYDRSFFAVALGRSAARIDFAAHQLAASEYEHAPFRFHVVIETDHD